MENTTQLFLAVRFNCNKCHDHPFERWTQDQYYHLAAYFAQVGRKADPSSARAQARRHAPSKEAMPLVEDHLRHRPRRGHARRHRQAGRARLSLSRIGELPRRRRSRREQLARWITSKDNPYFAKSYVNRLWSYLLGVGIIEPIDDIRAGNPPTNPELLDRLTSEFIDSGFNVQHMLRDDLQVARLSAVDGHEQVEPGRRHQLLARHRPPAAGRSAVRRDPRGHRLGEPPAGRARRLSRGAAARRRR